MTQYLITLAFIEGIGGPELLMVLFVVMLLFGGEKLPALARTIGKSMNELKKASSEVEREIKRAMEEHPAEDKSLKEPVALPPSPPALVVPQVELQPEASMPTPPSPPPPNSGETKP